LRNKVDDSRWPIKGGFMDQKNLKFLILSLALTCSCFLHIG